MPADERATLTPEEWVKLVTSIDKVIHNEAGYVDVFAVQAILQQALKERDRLAREDCMGKAEMAAKAFRAVQMQAAAAAAKTVADTIRASITTDEG